MNKALIVTGIGDDTHHLELATKGWAGRYEIEPVMHIFGWEGDVEGYDERLEHLRNHAWEIGAKAIIGVSAGASAGAIVASEMNLCYTNVCGRLREEGNNIYKFEKYRNRAPRFVESVRRAESILDQLDPEKSLIYWARFDEMVPKKAALVHGITAKVAPLPTHGLGIYSVLRTQGTQISQLITNS